MVTDKDLIEASKRMIDAVLTVIQPMADQRQNENLQNVSSSLRNALEGLDAYQDELAEIGECECCGKRAKLTIGNYVVHGRIFTGAVCDECRCSDEDLKDIFEDEVEQYR